MLELLWNALGGEARCAADLAVEHPGRYLPATFDVDGLAVGAVGCALLAGAELAEARGAPRPEVALDARHVAAAFASERHLRRDGRPPAAAFAPLSRFAPARDGWIRLHANYPHHRSALLAVLGTRENRALDAIADRSSVELEEAIVAAGGAAAGGGTAAAWREHPQGRAAAALPVVERRPGALAAPRESGRPDPRQPAVGLRVLDVTRVIAGPVATRFLAALGADVLRIDPPATPELELGILDTCPGKRVAGLDLRGGGGAATLARLLAGADAVAQGYRPGALAAFGLDEPTLAERHPRLVVATLGAWGRGGPWEHRRGFDSLVQAACGIADAEGDVGAPGALPVQALDHATGYLMAAAVLRALAARARGDDAANARFALAATAAELMRHPAPPAEAEVADADPFRFALDHQGGTLSVIAPPGALDGAPLRWRHGPAVGAAPSWQY
jgi:hypothetical protein